MYDNTHFEVLYININNNKMCIAFKPVGLGVQSYLHISGKSRVSMHACYMQL